MQTIDYDLISPGMKKGKRQEWRYLTTHEDGSFRVFLWTCEPKLSDGAWCFKNSDVMRGQHCAELPFVPECYLPCMDLKGAPATSISEINYMVSPVERDFFHWKPVEEEPEQEEQLLFAL